MVHDDASLEYSTVHVQYRCRLSLPRSQILPQVPPRCCVLPAATLCHEPRLASRSSFVGCDLTIRGGKDLQAMFVICDWISRRSGRVLALILSLLARHLSHPGHAVYPRASAQERRVSQLQPCSRNSRGAFLRSSTFLRRRRIWSSPTLFSFIPQTQGATLNT